MNNMKNLRKFEEFSNVSGTKYGVGDQFDPFGLAYFKNSLEPHTLVEYRGYHPNVIVVTDTLTITEIRGNELIFNGGKYIIDSDKFYKEPI